MMTTMAQAKQTPQEFIQNVFSPSIAAICSSDAEDICHKNNLSFVELIQPFCRFNSEATFKDPMNQPCYVRSLRIIIKDININPPQQTAAKKTLHEVVSTSQLPNENNRSITIKSVESEIILPVVLPWFEAYRDCFFEITYPSDHEFTKHFLACLFVVSSSNHNPVAELTRLNEIQHQMQHQNPSKLPKWFLPNIFKGYIILHDISEGDNAKAEADFQSAKSTFPGSFCHLLQINSRSSNIAHQMVSIGNDSAQPADPWSQFLSKKIDTSDTADYDNSPRTPQEDNIFPNKLSEGGSDLDITQITEIATEVTEIMPESNNTFQHPVSPNSDVLKKFISQDKAEKTLKIETVNEEDTPLAGVVNDAVVIWTKEQQPPPRPHGLCLTVSDMDRLRIFIHEFVIRGLLPYVEKQMKFLHEAVATRKGLHRSLLSATKKWFVGNKPGFQGQNSPTNTVVYSQEATELQVRKLGDLAFMFQHYDLAYQAYHTAKRDFNNDQAWLYFAGALEMAALSVFMLGSSSQRQYPFHYFENAINTYLNICKSPQFATRATLLSSECLKSKGMFGEAAMQFIKMTSEDSDLRSALLLEQAAHCFTAMPTPMIRKYAFHMILAGHRFSKAGQRKHALRAYKQAYQVYKNKNWSLAEDHVNFTIGRQSLNLKLLGQALSAFQNLLNKNSQQSASQQTAFLREYLFVYNLSKEQNITNDCQYFLPVPIIENQSTKVILGPVDIIDKEGINSSSLSFDDDEEEDRQWFMLEEMAYRFVHGSSTTAFRPNLQRLTQYTNNFYKPFTVLKEPITVEIVMSNPFHIPLLLGNIHLLWQFETERIGEDGQVHCLTITNDDTDEEKNSLCDDVMKTEIIVQLVLESSHVEKVHLSLRPQCLGKLLILGIGYELGTYYPTPLVEGSSDSLSVRNSNAVIARGKQYIETRGPKLNNTKAEKTSKTYGPDYRLHCVVVPSMPYLQVNFLNYPLTMLCGEIQQVVIELTNTGDDDIINICVASSTPELFTFGQTDVISSTYATASASSPSSVYSDFVGKPSETMVEVPLIDRVCYVLLPEESTALKAGQTYKLPMWIRAPDEAGLHNMRFLFYYESSNNIPEMTYRVYRHTAQVLVKGSLQVKGFAIHSLSQLVDDNIISLAVPLEVENISEAQDMENVEITVVQVSSASKKWVLQPIGNCSEQGIKICPKEACHLCLRAIKIPAQSLGQTDPFMLFSNVSFTNREIDSSTTPCSDFCYRSQLNLLPLVADEFTTFQADFSSSALMTSLTSSVLQNDQSIAIDESDDLEKTLQVGLTVIVIWKAMLPNSHGSLQCIMGQHHMTIDRINSFTSRDGDLKLNKDHTAAIENEQLVNELDSLSNNISLMQLVQTVVLHPHQIDHNFEVDKTCISPVTVIIHNCTDNDLFIIIDAMKPSGSFPLSKSSLCQPSGYLATFLAPSAVAFTWIGTTYNCLTVQPGETHRICLKACFFVAGTYNLGNIYVGARFLSSSDQPLVPQHPSAPSLVTVNNVSHPS